MRRPWPSVGIAGVALATFRLIASEAQQTPTFPAGVELVRIDVVVLNKNGVPVEGLTASDFEIVEAGKSHEIASFEPVVVRSLSKTSEREEVQPARISSPLVAAPEKNRHLLIFFDDIHVGPVPAERVRKQLGPFLAGETQEGDWVTVVSPLAGLRWTARTGYERRLLPEVIGRLKGQYKRNPFKDGMGDFEAMRRVEYGGRQQKGPPHQGQQFSPDPDLVAQELYDVAQRRIRRSLAALDEAVEALTGFRGRKTLIFYSEGFVLSPSLRAYEDVIDRARRSRVTIYFVDPRGLGTGADEDSPSMMALDSAAGGALHLSYATGGRPFVSNDLTLGLRAAVAESTAYYFIGFQPSPGGPGERRIKARVKREGLRVHAPDRYFVGERTTTGPRVSPAIQALNQEADATGISLRVATLFLEDSVSGAALTTLAVELPSRPGATGERHLSLLVEARPVGRSDVIRDAAELTVPPSPRATVATREVQLHPGIWQARVLVRDPKTEELGSVLHTFEVPESSSLRLSSPIISAGWRELPLSDRDYNSTDASNRVTFSTANTASLACWFSEVRDPLPASFAEAFPPC